MLNDQDDHAPKKEHDTATLTHARQTTLAALVDNVSVETIQELTQLTLPEIRELEQEVSRVLPAGNLPAFILSGLVSLKERHITSDRVRRDLNALLQGVNLLPQGLYGLFIAGPAAVLYGYQKLLRLAGKDIDHAFPQGTWQFYLEFGLREDSARHTNETMDPLSTDSTRADDEAQAAAWVLAAIEMLTQYETLLAVDWQERVMLRIIQEIVDEEDSAVNMSEAPQLKRIARTWSAQRPYHRPSGDVPYLTYRQEIFERFLAEHLATLPAAVQTRIRQRYAEREAQELTAYQKQMSILASLRPAQYQDHKVRLPLWRAAIGFIWQGRTYILPAFQRDAQGSPLCQPADPDVKTMPLYSLADGTLCDAQRRPLQVDADGTVRYAEMERTSEVHPTDKDPVLGTLKRTSDETVLAWVKGILGQQAATFREASFRFPEGSQSDIDLLLVQAPRSQQAALRAKLPESTQAAIEALHRAPILINWDPRPSALPLALIRQAHRGVGDHALTIFRTEESLIFDQSHIFFDGMWGIAVAEILTDHARHAYRRLTQRRIRVRAGTPKPLMFDAPPAVIAEIQHHVQPREAAAESNAVDMKSFARLRTWLRQRGVRLTVNDILVLARFIHATAYEPSGKVKQALRGFQRTVTRSTYETVTQAIKESLTTLRETNPALLIPMDASNVSPQERLFPTTFRNPLTKIPALYSQARDRYLAYHETPNKANWRAFDHARRELLAHLKTFGQLLDTVKAVTMRGESFNTATIRLLGHLSPSMQYLLDSIPQRIGMLNEIIKGNEVFSNVGRVAQGSTLRRFTSAKDDGESKVLVWGILTDDQNVMHISLRDFRKFVPLLLALEREEAPGAENLAHLLAQDYLDSYVTTLNHLVKTLGHLVTVKEGAEGG
jgi:hypothetical protein